jgi:Transketolase, C-terminal domain
MTCSKISTGFGSASAAASMNRASSNAFVDDYRAPRLANRGEHSLGIERPQNAEVDYLRFDPLLRQRLRRVEGWRSGSLSAEISARIMEGAFWELDAPVGRVCSSEVPIPYPHHLEEAALPQPAAIVAAAKATLGG